MKKENIFVQVAGMRATKKITGPKIVEVGNGEDAESEVPDAEEVTKDDGSSTSPGRSRTTSTTSADTLEIDFDVDEVVKATELLIIDVSEVSAVFNDAVWGFEQTYFPYLKGNGQFDVDMSNGAIRLVFELRKRRKVKKGNDSGDKGEVEWEPVLCLHDRSCSIGSVDFTMQGGSRLAWVVNKAAAMFKGVLRDYVVRSILRILTDKSGW